MAGSGTASNPSAFDGSLSMTDSGESRPDIKFTLPQEMMATVSKTLHRQLGHPSAASAATSEVRSASADGVQVLVKEIVDAKEPEGRGRSGRSRSPQKGDEGDHSRASSRRSNDPTEHGPARGGKPPKAPHTFGGAGHDH